MPALLLLLLLSLPFIAGAQITYEPLVGIPGVDNAATNFGKYLEQLYFLSISIAALIAVVKIIIAGVNWMLTDLISGKSDAKKDIQNSLLGLLLIVSAVIILETINPQLTNLNVLRYAAPAPQTARQTPAQQITITPGVGAVITPANVPAGQPPRQEMTIFPQQGASYLEASAYENRCDQNRPISYEVCTTIPNGSCQGRPPPRTTTTPPPAVAGVGPREVVIQVSCTPRQ